MRNGTRRSGPGPGRGLANLGEVRRQYGERRCDDKVVMAASRLQAEPASRARLEDELSKLFAQEIAAGRMLRDSQRSAPHGGAEPLDQPRLADDQAVSLRRAGERAIAADQADADVRRCFRQQFRSGVAEAALIEDEEVEAGEVRCDQGELLAQRRLRQAQRRADGEPVGLDVEEHERAVVAPAGEIETGDELQIGGRHVAPRSRRPENGLRLRLREPREPQSAPRSVGNFYFLAPPHAPSAEVRKSFGRFPKRLSVRVREPREPQSAPSRLGDFYFLAPRPAMAGRVPPGRARYSAIISPDPPNSFGKSFSFGRPSRMGSTVSA